MTGTPYAILASAIPPERTGVYMGIFNMMIVTPMLLFGVLMARLDLGPVAIGLGLYERLLGNDPRAMLHLCGLCLIAAALAVLAVREGGPAREGAS